MAEGGALAGTGQDMRAGPDAARGGEGWDQDLGLGQGQK